MDSTSVNVYITSIEGYHRIAAKVDRSKLIHFSELAASQLKNGTPIDQRLPKYSVTLARGAADGKALARVTTWIETNDIQEPKQMTLAGLKLERFDDIVLTYATGYAMRLKRDLRGDDLRNALYDYLHQGSLTHDEFAMLVEWLPFDGGLIKTAVHQAMFRGCKGGTFVPPDMAKIEEYAKRVGMWEEMLAAKVEIRAKMDERDRRDAEAGRPKREKWVSATAGAAS
ncbi:hypothetical protein LTR56_010052 [Elasticomyces elasticus]|nr:hypothetical protein LTR56_010052 [Elasticomyces elasticus]KAK3665004.1 hypothetical protein LTR22_004056 [Elasticomyces elasticus]KAK4931620.1 hypothetical protein LTR49_002012 [Elasticomyces elasticus]KAK5766779.1 hypothetical protein LTS12_003132 [Elasticomyces elasticus]